MEPLAVDRPAHHRPGGLLGVDNGFPTRQRLLQGPVEAALHPYREHARRPVEGLQKSSAGHVRAVAAVGARSASPSFLRGSRLEELGSRALVDGPSWCGQVRAPRLP